MEDKSLDRISRQTIAIQRKVNELSKKLDDEKDAQGDESEEPEESPGDWVGAILISPP
jgi:hypothetical protein